MISHQLIAPNVIISSIYMTTIWTGKTVIYLFVISNLQVIPLITQAINFRKALSWFRHKLGKSESKKKLSKAVYLFSIGANDYLSQFLTDSLLLKSYSHSEYVGMVLGNLTTVIKVIKINFT